MRSAAMTIGTAISGAAAEVESRSYRDEAERNDSGLANTEWQWPCFAHYWLIVLGDDGTTSDNERDSM